MLEGAEIEVDRKNPGRFRKRIEAALDVLANDHEMQGTPIIEPTFDSGIIITPPASLIRSYEDIERRRGKLAG